MLYYKSFYWYPLSYQINHAIDVLVLYHILLFHSYSIRSFYFEEKKGFNERKGKINRICPMCCGPPRYEKSHFFTRYFRQWVQIVDLQMRQWLQIVLLGAIDASGGPRSWPIDTFRDPQSGAIDTVGGSQSGPTDSFSALWSTRISTSKKCWGWTNLKINFSACFQCSGGLDI
jgi:hypothetical protein